MLGILCGFELEAKVARLYTPLVACSGAREAVAHEKAEWLAKSGATRLLSFGIAGALTKDVMIDSMVVGSGVRDKNGKAWECDEAFAALLLQAFPGAIRANVYGSPVLVPGAADKEALSQKSGCKIVDMESQAIAETGTKYKLPFGVLRGISDTVDDMFPEAAFLGINADGSTNYGAVFGSLMKNPGQLPALLHLAKNTDAVLRVLKSRAAHTAQLLEKKAA